MKVGEIDHAMDDIIGYLTQMEADLAGVDNIYGDPRFIEIHMKKLQVQPLKYF